MKYFAVLNYCKDFKPYIIGFILFDFFFNGVSTLMGSLIPKQSF